MFSGPTGIGERARMAESGLPSFHGIIGRSAPMRALFDRIERVARFDIPVLIRGESGTGKELVAAAIQRLSPRRERRFATVNCGALTRDLLRSELFGHERGAFTGAITKKHGILAVTDGGTVFLDEIGELPVDAQVMLLRFLQSGEIQPVGSNETRHVNVRLIAATHRDLKAAIGRGAFREDLYYRLRGVEVDVPPLRERRDDIALMVEHFVAVLNERHGLSVRGATREALRQLEQYAWPGNVRELEAIIAEAMVLANGEWITPEGLGLSRSSGAAVADAPSSPATALSWLQREALRIIAERREVRRRDIVAWCRVSRELARRELAGLVRLGLLRRIGFGRSARYVPLSFWLTFIADTIEWGTMLV
jgi:DNA-binding NtrC family response regulator